MKVTRKYETGTFENRNPSSAADYGISMDDQIKLKSCFVKTKVIPLGGFEKTGRFVAGRQVFTQNSIFFVLVEKTGKNLTNVRDENTVETFDLRDET